MKNEFDERSIAWVFDEDGFRDLLASLDRASEVTYDLETTGLDEWATRGGKTNDGIPALITMASFTVLETPNEENPVTWVLPLHHPESPFIANERAYLGMTADVMKLARIPLNGHNIKFDCRWTNARTGIDISGLVEWDSQVAAHLMDETQSTKLKEVVPRMFEGVERWDDFDLSKPGASLRVPLIQLGVYAARDTYWSWRLKQRQKQLMFLDGSGRQPMFPDEVELARLGKLAVHVSMPTVRSLTKVEQAGIRLDTAEAEKVLAEVEEPVVELSEKLEGKYEGLPPEVSWAPTSNWFRAWTEAAVDAGDLRVGALTKTGKAQWSKAILMRQARKGSEVAADLLELRKFSKRAEFLRTWLTVVTPASRIHAQYNVGSVVSGRTSSSEPNMQQVTKALRPCFVASPGHVIIDLDYSQIEMRVAAFLSRCLPMIEAFREGKDTHRMMAAAITKKPIEDINDDERQKGKSANFGLLFGMGVNGFMIYAESVYGVLITEEEARVAHEAYFDLWVGLREWHAKMRRIVNQTGQVMSPIGRVRRLPDVWSTNEERQQFSERAAINSPVQGFASDLMQTAAALINGTYDDRPGVRGATIVGTVHDSIVVEAPEDDWERVRDECIHIMEVTVLEVMRELDCDFDVPIKADAKVGTRWGLADIAE